MPSPMRALLITALAACGSEPPAPTPTAPQQAQRPAPPPPVTISGPQPEVLSAPAISLPPVPTFEVPVMPDGIHGVRELRVAGRDQLGNKLRVAGYVTWIYDCIVEMQRPGQSRAEVQKQIDADPTICQRAKFYLGDARDTPPERALWVVDVPRPFNKLERERLRKSDRTPENFPDRCEPDPKRRGPFCTELAVGDYVVLDGTFAVVSPHSERNNGGLLVWGGVQKQTPPASVALRVVEPAARPALPQLSLVPVPPPPTAHDAQVASSQLTNAGTRAFGAKDFATAIAKLTAATSSWPGNHAAWYYLAGARMRQDDARGAIDAIRRAFELSPREPMYAMWYGVIAYQYVRDDARQAEARRLNLPPSTSIDIDTSHLDFAQAEALLRHAVSLDPRLWRADYFLGRIARDGGRPKDAAEAFTAALAYAPADPAPWIALGELYRAWDQPELAVTVMSEGVKHVDRDAGDAWFVLGMALDDLRRDAPALDAFDRALASDPTDAKALFQRGQLHYRMKAFAEAKRDLEAFIATPKAMVFAKQQASQMLVELAGRPRR